MKYCLWTILQTQGDGMYPSLCEAKSFPLWLSSSLFSGNVNWVDDRDSKVTTQTPKTIESLHPSWLLIWTGIDEADMVTSWRFFFSHSEIHREIWGLSTPNPQILFQSWKLLVWPESFTHSTNIHRVPNMCRGGANWGGPGVCTLGTHELQEKGPLKWEMGKKLQCPLTSTWNLAFPLIMNVGNKP